MSRSLKIVLAISSCCGQESCIGSMRNLEVWSLGMALGKFMECARQNPVDFLSLQPLLQFFSDGGELKLGQLLNAYPPFMMKQASDGVSLKAVSMFEQISFLADLASQIGDVPEGTDVRMMVINVPES